MRSQISHTFLKVIFITQNHNLYIFTKNNYITNNDHINFINTFDQNQNNELGIQLTKEPEGGYDFYNDNFEKYMEIVDELVNSHINVYPTVDVSTQLIEINVIKKARSLFKRYEKELENSNKENFL